MKKNIAIIMGGYSSEYLISLKSGRWFTTVYQKQATMRIASIFLKINGYM